MGVHEDATHTFHPNNVGGSSDDRVLAIQKQMDALQAEITQFEKEDANL